MFTKLKIAVNKYSQKVNLSQVTRTMFGKAEGRLSNFKLGLQKTNSVHLLKLICIIEMLF